MNTACSGAKGPSEVILAWQNPFSDHQPVLPPYVPSWLPFAIHRRLVSAFEMSSAPESKAQRPEGRRPVASSTGV
eukprot:6325740-Amphidinium_carterae.1